MAEQPLEPLSAVPRPQSLKDIAYRAIKDAILTFKLKPGQALSHRDLAAQLQISETPVRDALQELEREGFVTRLAYKGTFVTEINQADIEETIQIRTALEALAVRLAVPHLDEDDIAKMTRLLEEASAALEEGDRERCSRLGAQFHQLFVRKAENRRLEAILDNLEDHMIRFRRTSDRISGRLEKSQGEHRRVLEAASEGDARRAGNAMLAHLESVSHDIKVPDSHWEDELE